MDNTDALLRRLARERLARHEAESIAERVTAELSRGPQSRDKGGTGLGLSIVLGLARAKAATPGTSRTCRPARASACGSASAPPESASPRHDSAARTGQSLAVRHAPGVPVFPAFEDVEPSARSRRQRVR